MNPKPTNTRSTPKDLKDKLWDEITKTIADRMPEQLFPLFQEAFGKVYAKGTPIRLIQTEYPKPLNPTQSKPTSVYSDIALLVNESDLYHLECQMANENDMVIRMIEYDFHLALHHGIQMDSPHVFTMYFPRSTVVYPEKNDKIPEYLTCRIIFPDESIHEYNVPTIRIQNYSLEEIKEKHLTFFLPFMLLSFRPRVRSKKNPVTPEELTEYVNRLILILREEYSNGNISRLEYQDYVQLITLAGERVFHSQQHLAKEVIKMTQPTILLPSDFYRLSEQLEKKDAELEKKDAEFAQMKAYYEQQIAELKKKQK